MTDRRTAIFACGAAGFTAAVSGLVTTRRLRARTRKAVLHVPADGRLVVTLAPGLTTTVQVSDRIFGGGFSLTETCFAPGTRTPLHVHGRADVTLVVTEGALELFVDDRWIKACAGATVSVPRGARLGILNATGEDARCLALHRPGGIESLLSALAVQGDGDRLALARSYGVEVLGPIPAG